MNNHATSDKLIICLLLSICGQLSGCLSTAPDLRSLMPETTLDATTIMQRAHAAAGGSTWQRPSSLSMQGYAVFYRDGQATRHEMHNMWRVYDWDKRAAHQADGKVRIESIRNGQAVINVSFDGTSTYTAKGKQPASTADQQWASSFGFGVIRHALDEGYLLTRLPDDLVDGHESFVVKVTDPTGSDTVFAVRHHDAAIVRVGFDTPRGWHERIYSNFFSNNGTAWRQPGRVRLYYNGVKSNEVIWTTFRINEALPECLFRLPESKDCRR